MSTLSEGHFVDAGARQPEWPGSLQRHETFRPKTARVPTSTPSKYKLFPLREHRSLVEMYSSGSLASSSLSSRQWPTSSSSSAQICVRSFRAAACSVVLLLVAEEIVDCTFQGVLLGGRRVPRPASEKLVEHFFDVVNVFARQLLLAHALAYNKARLHSKALCAHHLIVSIGHRLESNLVNDPPGQTKLEHFGGRLVAKRFDDVLLRRAAHRNDGFEIKMTVSTQDNIAHGECLETETRVHLIGTPSRKELICCDVGWGLVV